MRFPRAETDPAKVKLAAFAHHVITAAVLLNCRSTFRTFLMKTNTQKLTCALKMTENNLV